LLCPCIFRSVACCSSSLWRLLFFQPENILCGDRIVDIKLADFGLSHLVNPHERMMMACGTLSYVGEYLSVLWFGTRCSCEVAERLCGKAQ
jgi:hypothetical protein